MNQPTELQEGVANAIQILDKLIEVAQEVVYEPNVLPALKTAFTLKESHGWGLKYSKPIQLHGEQWFAAFESIKPIIATGGIVAMIGPRGPGKTQMAAEIAREQNWPEDKTESTKSDGITTTHHSRTPIYRRAMDIFLDLREASKNHVKSSEKEVLATLSHCGLLVVDEFQERGESEWEDRIMKNLIDKRYASGRPTIIIANLSRKELFDALGSSIVDRARENGKSIEFNWASYRNQP
jgi:DNA replication protein DnaC